MGAKQVHVFDRTADETISWIQEKGGLLAAEDYGHDLDTIQTLIQKHQGFEADLAAVKEQVLTVLLLLIIINKTNYTLHFIHILLLLTRLNASYKKLVDCQPCFQMPKITSK